MIGWLAERSVYPVRLARPGGPRLRLSWVAMLAAIEASSCAPKPRPPPPMPAFVAANDCLMRVAEQGAKGDAPARALDSLAMKICKDLVEAAKIEAFARSAVVANPSKYPRCNARG